MTEPTTTTVTVTTTTTATTASEWGTLEELLLASAVHRHGTAAWDAVAGELRNRLSSSTLSLLVSPRTCEKRYAEVKNRFSGENSGADDVTARWLDELRSLRKAELRRELDRYDHNIVSLQLKVKRLEEEREREREEREGPDLQSDQERERVESPGNDVIAGETRRKTESEAEVASLERVNSDELGESVAESKGGGGGGVKESSDVGSEAGMSMKKAVEFAGKVVELLEALKEDKQIGSVFQRRLESQETPRYRKLIRQHIDLGIIQRRLEEGQYADSNTKFYRDLMLLISNATVFFTNRSPEHQAALELRQLVNKQLQSHQIHSNSHPPKLNPPAPLQKPAKSDPDPPVQTINLKPKLSITGPVIACRKRSSIAGKPSVGGEKKEPSTDEKEKATKSSSDDLTKKRTREQSFGGSRSSSSKNNINSNNNKSTRPSSSPSPSSTQVPSPKTDAKGDKKKPSTSIVLSKTKRGLQLGNGLLDLLKNSASEKNGKNERDKDQRSRDGSGSKPGKEKGKGKDKEKDEGERMLSRSIGRPPKRAAAVAAMGKRGRESGGEAEPMSRKRQRK